MKKRNFSQYVLTMAAAAIMVTAIFILATGCSVEGGKQYKFGIILQIENGAFIDMRDGIIVELKDNGYTDDNAEFVYQSAQGDMTALSTIATSMDDGSYTAVFTVGTAATQQFVNLESKTPNFFCAVSAPVEAQVITDMEKPDKNATGTSNAIPVEDIFALADILTPNISKWGVIYSTSQTNAVHTAQSAVSYLNGAGIAYVEAAIADTSEVSTAVQALLSQGVEAIFVPNDQVIQSTINSLTDLCLEAGIPTYVSSATTVASGGFATLAIDDIGIGRKTARLALEYIRDGKAIADIPAVVVGIDYCSINQNVFEQLGVTVPENLGYEVQYLGDD